ncbi:MAG: efflux RND transporter periplasmic adaptor subunit [Alphaproteobacteria bacterium]|jgi:multidrug efflux system membrane fusion protein|nr:efflux RND transporter periplasmic adaptor subunit [Alphaproteobacteria bacterium]MCB1550632.1 efflux RND transporter periplasmic adaptor subunit [Alphaproteobacteria bacterium]MCB9985944.1 efflux RND transporter periplasmic adaptor subunit [Micavibrio sp.]HPQ50208.1 efflux RND transporter periplasmic adaptor subunit [Alphaproteobacteria bacterium]HRK96901.1 efflux RND transporter periplasmic adaptor subunit [Alphaproteobacteria bacterium]
MNKKISVIIIFLAFIAGGVFAAAQQFLPKTVSVSVPHRGVAIKAVYATGTVEPSVMIPLAPRATGRLSSLEVDEGDQVKKGDILARFEDTDLSAAIEQIMAQVDLAKKEKTRKEILVKRKFISAEAYDKSVSDLTVAEAALKEAQARQSYLTLIAPEDATIIRRDGEIGEVITANDPVFYLSCCAPIRISAEVDEEDIVHVLKGQKVLIQSDAFPDDTFEGKVIAITPKGDPTSRSFRVRISVPENFPMLIGMTAETNIVTNESENAILIPASALGKKNAVQVVTDHKIVMKTVKIGTEGKDQVEIIRGLTETDLVVSPYNNELEAGQQVRAKTRVTTGAK